MGVPRLNMAWNPLFEGEKMNSNNALVKAKNIIEAFDYGEVSLLKSHWKSQRDYVADLYLGLDNGALLESAFRESGITSGEQPLPGWGGTFGQMLAAYTKLYCATGDERLKAKVLSIYGKWSEAAKNEPQLYRLGTYDFDKLLGGLLDMYEFLDDVEVEESVSRLVDTAIATFDPSIPRDGLQNERMKGQIEWYTLPENLYRAYKDFGEDKYKDFAETWHYDYYWNKFLKHDFSIGPRHAYSHVNCLSSAAMAYRMSGDPTLLKMLKIAYDELTEHHTYATGGYGPGENLFIDRPGYMGFMLQSPWDLGDEDPTFINFAGSKVARSDAWGSCEVSCCSWAVFKLCNYLLQFTGEAKYGAWAEQMLYNCVGGQPDIKPNGELLYYSSYFADGAMKSTVDRRLQREGQNFQWQCCSGTFPQDVAEYSQLLYFHDDDALYVTQYLPSSINWQRGGKALKIENISDFPLHDTIQFRVSASSTNDSAKIKLRVPHWAMNNNSVRINGQKIDVDIKPDTWLVLDRRWGPDDLIEIEYPFSLRFNEVDDEHPDLVALTYGPLAMVCDEMTLLVGDRNRPETWIKPVDGKLLTFRTLPGHSGEPSFTSRTFVPYYLYPDDKWYFMYHNIYRDKEEKKVLTRTINA
jgi:hypothetical protein